MHRVMLLITKMNIQHHTKAFTKLKVKAYQNYTTQAAKKLHLPVCARCKR
jgi:hypothetical protein